MLRGVLAVASIALTIFALADCIQSQDDQVRGLPKWAWIVLIVLVPWIGPITWLLIGKDREGGAGRSYESPYGSAGMRPGQASASGAPRGAGSSARPRRSGPIAPDDDPEFLRKLDEDIRRERRAKAAGESGAAPVSSTDGSPASPASDSDARPGSSTGEDGTPGSGSLRPEDPDAGSPEAPQA